MILFVSFCKRIPSVWFQSRATEPQHVLKDRSVLTRKHWTQASALETSRSQTLLTLCLTSERNDVVSRDTQSSYSDWGHRKGCIVGFFCHLQNVNCEMQLQPPKNTRRAHETFSKPKIKALQRTSFSVFSEKPANSSIDGAYLSNWSPDFESWRLSAQLWPGGLHQLRRLLQNIFTFA